jgi:hypothetical protein
MLQLANLQKKIDEAAEEMHYLTQDDQDRRPQHWELRQESPINEDEWYDDFYHDNFAFDDASPLATELQATSWPPSYKPPQLPMYDGHSDPKQFLMSYEAIISSYGGNTAVMAKSFVMVVRSVAQTWYSSLRPGTITSWQKLKDMLVTSFQGFQTKPVSTQALFQCTQDHEEYLQAYVHQAPTVPNEIDIEAMIKGLRPESVEVTIQKQKEIAEAEAQQNQPKQVLHTTSCYSPYIPEYVGNQQPTTSAASASHSQASWAQLPPPPPLAPASSHDQ